MDALMSLSRATENKPAEPQRLGAVLTPIRAETPPDLEYFTKDWLLKQPGTAMAWLEGWQPRVNEGAVNTPLAFLTDMKQRVQWEDVGPAGARWHGASRTPGGEWLKAPWHPTHWREDQANLLETYRKLMSEGG